MEICHKKEKNKLLQPTKPTKKQIVKVGLELRSFVNIIQTLSTRHRLIFLFTF